MLAELDRPAEQANKPSVRRWAPLSGGAPHQIVFLCHGYGSGPNQLSRMLPEWQEAAPHAAFVAPRAPEARVPRLRDQLLGRRPPGLGNQWFGLGRMATMSPETGVRRAAQWLDAFMDQELAAQGVPAGASALIGFSQGSIVALYTALRRQAGLACVICHAAELLSPEMLDEELACRPQVTLILAEDDDVVPSSCGLAAEAALRTAGVPVSVAYLDGLAHECLKGVDENSRAMIAGIGAQALREAFAA